MACPAGALPARGEHAAAFVVIQPHANMMQRRLPQACNLSPSGCSGRHVLVRREAARRSQLFFQYGLQQRCAPSGAFSQRGPNFSNLSQSLFQWREASRDQEAIAALARAAEEADIPATTLVGASAKQLFETAVHSLDTFEPRTPASVDDEQVFDSLEEQREGVALQSAVSKANYEVRGAAAARDW